MKNKAKIVAPSASFPTLYPLKQKYPTLNLKFKLKLLILVFGFGLALFCFSCKTCKCPAYTFTQPINATEKAI